MDIFPIHMEEEIKEILSNSKDYSDRMNLGDARLLYNRHRNNKTTFWYDDCKGVFTNNEIVWFLEDAYYDRDQKRWMEIRYPIEDHPKTANVTVGNPQYGYLSNHLHGIQSAVVSLLGIFIIGELDY